MLSKVSLKTSGLCVQGNSSKSFVATYQTARCHNPKDIMNLHPLDNLMSVIESFCFILN